MSDSTNPGALKRTVVQGATLATLVTPLGCHTDRAERTVPHHSSTVERPAHFDHGVPFADSIMVELRHHDFNRASREEAKNDPKTPIDKIDAKLKSWEEQGYEEWLKTLGMTPKAYAKYAVSPYIEQARAALQADVLEQAADEAYRSQGMRTSRRFEGGLVRAAGAIYRVYRILDDLSNELQENPPGMPGRAVDPSSVIASLAEVKTDVLGAAAGMIDREEARSNARTAASR